MSYAAVRDAVLAKLQSIPGFDIYNVAYEDYQCLNAGVRHALIVRYQSFAAERNTFAGGEMIVWRFSLELYTPFTSLPESRAAEDTDRQLVVDAFNDTNGLAGMFESWIGAGQRTDEPHEIGDSRWFTETYTLEVTEMS